MVIFHSYVSLPSRAFEGVLQVALPGMILREHLLLTALSCIIRVGGSSQLR